MKTIVTIFGPTGLPVESVLVEEGERRVVQVRATHLVSAGQTMEISVGANPVPLGKRTIGEVIADIRQHYRDEPTHGYNCICMDQRIREVRQLFRDGFADRPAGDKISREDYKSMTSLRYVFDTALNSMNLHVR